jgi:microcystin-dependent protein
MANVAHSSLTGADLHEPKGAATATSGQVYVADGAGSGAWTAGDTLVSFTGMIADFATPTVPTGWLECDGSSNSRATYADLFAAQTIQQSGTRTSGTAIITGLSSTTHMKAGYFIGGTGIPTSATILSVDSATQVTMSTNASSSGTSTVIVSPWGLGDGSTTFELPNTKKRYRRSRENASSIFIGAAQTELVKAHSHTASASGSIASGTESQSHTHSGTTSTESQSHTHDVSDTTTSDGSHEHGIVGYINTGGSTAGLVRTTTGTSGETFQTDNESAHSHDTSDTSGSASQTHTHTVTTGNASQTHTHTTNMASATITVADNVGTENRPLTVVVLTCVKT